LFVFAHRLRDCFSPIRKKQGLRKKKGEESKAKNGGRGSKSIDKQKKLANAFKEHSIVYRASLGSIARQVWCELCSAEVAADHDTIIKHIANKSHKEKITERNAARAGQAAAVVALAEGANARVAAAAAAQAAEEAGGRAGDVHRRDVQLQFIPADSLGHVVGDGDARAIPLPSLKTKVQREQEEEQLRTELIGGFVARGGTIALLDHLCSSGWAAAFVKLYLEYGGMPRDDKMREYLKKCYDQATDEVKNMLRGQVVSVMEDSTPDAHHDEVWWSCDALFFFL
jgi:hypothetical protein